MCGRYVLQAPEDLSERFQLRNLSMLFEPTWNAAPQQVLPVIVEGADGRLEARGMRWGLQPAWGPAPGKPAIAPFNARAETVGAKPMFRGALARRRCLVPASGFYEWQALDGRKQPWFISVPGEPVFAFAGLYEEPPAGEDRPASFTIITTTPNPLMARLHDRMPVILHRDDEADWLDPERTDPAALMPLLQPYPADQMTAWPVGRGVGNVRNDSPDLIVPDPDGAAGQANLF